jgi:hypothetical protein
MQNDPLVGSFCIYQRSQVRTDEVSSIKTGESVANTAGFKP